MLNEAPMNATDIVSIATYVTVNVDRGLTMMDRDSTLMGYRVAGSLATVPRSVEPDLLVEVAVVASEACR
jgi:hypothetical protein